MSLTSPRLIAPIVVLSLAALAMTSCAEQHSPTAPSSVTPSTVPSPAVEYFVTLADETPSPNPGDALPPGDPAATPSAEPSPLPGSAPAPWPPGPPPIAAPGVPVPTPPSTHFRVTIKIDPEPVPYSGTPVPLYACRDLKHTWYYDQRLSTDTGVPVTFTERQNFLDGRFVNKNTETIHIDGNSGVVLHTRWCSGYPKPHYAQTRFKGRDDYGEPIEISGPWVRLLAP